MEVSQFHPEAATAAPVVWTDELHQEVQNTTVALGSTGSVLLDLLAGKFGCTSAEVVARYGIHRLPEAERTAYVHYLYDQQVLAQQLHSQEGSEAVASPASATVAAGQYRGAAFSQQYQQQPGSPSSLHTAASVGAHGATPMPAGARGPQTGAAAVDQHQRPPDHPDPGTGAAHGSPQATPGGAYERVFDNDQFDRTPSSSAQRDREHHEQYHHQRQQFRQAHAEHANKPTASAAADRPAGHMPGQQQRPTPHGPATAGFVKPEHPHQQYQQQMPGPAAGWIPPPPYMHPYPPLYPHMAAGAPFPPYMPYMGYPQGFYGPAAADFAAATAAGFAGGAYHMPMPHPQPVPAESQAWHAAAPLEPAAAPTEPAAAPSRPAAAATAAVPAAAGYQGGSMHKRLQEALQYVDMYKGTVPVEQWVKQVEPALKMVPAEAPPAVVAKAVRSKIDSKLLEQHSGGILDAPQNTDELLAEMQRLFKSDPDELMSEAQKLSNQAAADASMTAVRFAAQLKRLYGKYRMSFPRGAQNINRVVKWFPPGQHTSLYVALQQAESDREQWTFSLLEKCCEAVDTQFQQQKQQQQEAAKTAAAAAAAHQVKQQLQQQQKHQQIPDDWRPPYDGSGGRGGRGYDGYRGRGRDNYRGRGRGDYYGGRGPGRGWGYEQESDVQHDRDSKPAGAQQGADLGPPKQDGQQRPAGRGQGQPAAGAMRVLMSNSRIGSTLGGGVGYDSRLSAKSAVVTAGHSAARQKDKSVQQQLAAAQAAMLLMEGGDLRQQDNNISSSEPADEASDGSLDNVQQQSEKPVVLAAVSTAASIAAASSDNNSEGVAAASEGSSSAVDPPDGEQLFTQLLWAADMHLRRRRPRAAEPVGPTDDAEQQEAVTPAWLRTPEAKRVLHVVTKAITPTTLGDLCALFGVSELQPIRDTLAVLWQCIEEAKKQRPELSGASACLLGSIELLEADMLAAAAAPTSVQKQQQESSVSSVFSNNNSKKGSKGRKGSTSSTGSTASSFSTPLSMGLALTVRPTVASSSTGGGNVSNNDSGSSSAGGSGGTVSGNASDSAAVGSAAAPAAAPDEDDSSGSESDEEAPPLDGPLDETESSVPSELPDAEPAAGPPAAAPGPYLAAANVQHAVVRIVTMAALYAKLRCGVITTPVTLHVDSGCNFSAISLQFFQQHRHHLLGPGSNATLYRLQTAATVGMFAGPNISTARYLITGVALDIGRGTYKQDFLVIEGANFEAVLGNDFLFGYAGRVWTRDVSNRDSGRYLVLPLFEHQCQPGVSPPASPPSAGPHWYPSQRVPLHYQVVEEAWPATVVTHLQV